VGGGRTGATAVGATTVGGGRTGTTAVGATTVGAATGTAGAGGTMGITAAKPARLKGIIAGRAVIRPTGVEGRKGITPSVDGAGGVKVIRAPVGAVVGLITALPNQPVNPGAAGDTPSQPPKGEVGGVPINPPRVGVLGIRVVPVVDQLGALGMPMGTTGIKVAAGVPKPPKVGRVGIKAAVGLNVGVVVGGVVPGAGGVIVMIGLKVVIGS